MECHPIETNVLLDHSLTTERLTRIRIRTANRSFDREVALINFIRLPLAVPVSDTALSAVHSSSLLQVEVIGTMMYF